jgi:ATP adenylyltransferase
MLHETVWSIGAVGETGVRVKISVDDRDKYGRETSRGTRTRCDPLWIRGGCVQQTKASPNCPLRAEFTIVVNVTVRSVSYVWEDEPVAFFLTAAARPMDQMWSPWRSKYVEEAAERSASDDGPSLFTRLAEDENDEKHLILWRGELVFVILNLHPYNNGHLLIVPYREVTDYPDLSTEEQTAIATTIDRCMRWQRRAFSPDGFNVGMNLGAAAGAGIPEHLHVHVVPRWSGDTNFMTTTDDTRVIPQDLHETYEALRTSMNASDASGT